MIWGLCCPRNRMRQGIWLPMPVEASTQNAEWNNSSYIFFKVEHLALKWTIIKIISGGIQITHWIIKDCKTWGYRAKVGGTVRQILRKHSDQVLHLQLWLYCSDEFEQYCPCSGNHPTQNYISALTLPWLAANVDPIKYFIFGLKFVDNNCLSLWIYILPRGTELFSVLPLKLSCWAANSLFLLRETLCHIRAEGGKTAASIVSSKETESKSKQALSKRSFPTQGEPSPSDCPLKQNELRVHLEDLLSDRELS